MIPLIDADILLYEIGFAAQQKNEEGLILKSVEEVNDMVDERIKEICAAVYATAPPKLFITGKGNFRHAVAKSREYKGNRKQIKPHYYSYIKAYLQFPLHKFLTQKKVRLKTLNNDLQCESLFRGN